MNQNKETKAEKVREQTVTRQLVAASRRQIRAVLSRDGLSMLFIFLWWPACTFHQFWNNDPPRNVHWFLTDVRKSNGELKMQDVQYYVFDTGNMVAFSFVLLSFILNKTKTRQYKAALLVSLVVSLSDIFHYWYNFKQSSWVVLLQGLAMVGVALWMLQKQIKKWTKV